MAKQATGQTINLAMMAKKKSDGQQETKTSSTKKYFNCKKENTIPSIVAQPPKEYLRIKKPSKKSEELDRRTT